jgi:hypothetical protein
MAISIIVFVFGWIIVKMAMRFVYVKEVITNDTDKHDYLIFGERKLFFKCVNFSWKCAFERLNKFCSLIFVSVAVFELFTKCEFLAFDHKVCII